MQATASAGKPHRSSATARFGVSAAYLLNEADIAPSGRDSPSPPPFFRQATKAMSLTKLGCTLSRAPLGRQTRMRYAGFWSRLLAYLVDIVPIVIDSRRVLLFSASVKLACLS